MAPELPQPCLFDFNTYLQKPHVQQALSAYFEPHRIHTASVSGKQAYSATQLTGGLVNVTARVALQRDGSKCTVILKYAPPFVAASLGNMPFGQFRQTIESRALFLLDETPSVKQQLERLQVRIPKPIWFDEHEHVLALEDLGEELVTLDDWLCSAGGFPELDVCETVGSRLGEALAVVHTDERLRERLDRTDFVNPDTAELVGEEVVGKIQELLNQYLPTDAEDPYLATSISTIIKNEYTRNDSTPEASIFSNGDLWTGSVLISKGGDANINTKPLVGVIDWEFAGAGRVLQDIGQLSAWLRLLAEAPAWASNPVHPEQPSVIPDAVMLTPSSKFAHACFTAYACRLRNSDKLSWMVEPRSDSDKQRRLRVIQSTWILHGREIIYNATSPDTAEKFSRLVPPDTFYSWRVHMVKLGCWYVLSANDSTLEFEATIAKECFLEPLYHLEW
ncbi:hypothetical protein AMATHDRAFT_46485 [Amanita thiersii Skay4041]|uniref:Aminoglycoside phosphotransferase domain-containing protein n=1 Tax=Amanita thiersii Skay4041 TaxID=703135 RepID=A0A2A9NWI0_9AGAR|nr:hypothetical protein AMATHDRAFT_46485 [Amanita thiersii Skay4041]